jgi:hypothetical protein
MGKNREKRKKSSYTDLNETDFKQQRQGSSGHVNAEVSDILSQIYSVLYPADSDSTASVFYSNENPPSVMAESHPDIRNNERWTYRGTKINTMFINIWDDCSHPNYRGTR